MKRATVLQFSLFPATLDEPQPSLDTHRGGDEPLTAGDVAREKRKRKKQRRTAADVLADGKWHEARELIGFAGWGYRNRLCELRDGGAVIHRRLTGPSLYAFRLDESRAVLAECDCRDCLCRPATAAGVAP